MSFLFMQGQSPNLRDNEGTFNNSNNLTAIEQAYLETSPNNATNLQLFICMCHGLTDSC